VSPPPRGGRRPPPRRPARSNRPVAEYHPRARRKSRRARTAARRRRFALIAGALVTVVLAAAAVGTIGGAAALGSSCDLNSLRPPSLGENSLMFAADGSLLGVIEAEKNRQPIKLAQMSPWLPKATVAIEDRRFYRHGGIDAEAVARALWKDIQAGKVVEGGSTLTQQLVRNLYIGKEQTLERKVKEGCLAIKLDRQRSKDWILQQYLNTVFYGYQAYGVEAAAQTYFSKPAAKLTLTEAALLAGLPQAPGDFDPFRKPGDALARRNAVLAAMLDTGAITPGAYEEAVAQRRLGLKAGKLYKEIREPYFFSYVKLELIKAYGAETVRSGGLKIYTTIDRRFQRIAQRTMREVLPYSDDPSAALVAINPQNGAIRAMTAISRRKGNKYNLASQARRQAGSTFKTFVLTTAIEKGINPDSTSYLSAPFKYSPDPTGSCDDEPPTAWCPETYDESYIGTASITRGTLRSDNSMYARLTLDVGPENVRRTARKMGIRSPLNPYPSLGLGAADVSPLEMASAYATLAAGGIYSQPMAIRKVVLANGKEDEEAGWGKPKRKRVLSDGVAYEVTRVLEQNIQFGTGYPNAVIGRDAAGKTGTTDNHADAWFCGYTPNLQATVWVGHPKGQIPMLSVHGIRVAGGTFPAEIWGKFMREALYYSPPQEWQEPRDWVEWDYWDGQYQFSGGDPGDDDTGYYAPAPVAQEEVEEEEEQEEEAPPATTQAPPPATTEPPPPVTTAPPVTTTEPPPIEP
jgi:penicillin-binding protein 1A